MAQGVAGKNEASPVMEFQGPQATRFDTGHRVSPAPLLPMTSPNSQPGSEEAGHCSRVDEGASPHPLAWQ